MRAASGSSSTRRPPKDVAFGQKHWLSTCCWCGGVAVVGVVVVVWYQQHVMMIDFTDGSFHYLLKIFHIYYTCRCASCRKQTFQMSPFRYDVGGQHTCLSRRIPGFESLYRNFLLFTAFIAYFVHYGCWESLGGKLEG